MSPTTGFDSFMFAQVVPYRVAAREVFVPCYLLSPLLPHLLYLLCSVVFLCKNILYIKLVLYHGSETNLLLTI